MGGGREKEAERWWRGGEVRERGEERAGSEDEVERFRATRQVSRERDVHRRRHDQRPLKSVRAYSTLRGSIDWKRIVDVAAGGRGKERREMMFAFDDLDASTVRVELGFPFGAAAAIYLKKNRYIPYFEGGRRRPR